MPETIISISACPALEIPIVPTPKSRCRKFCRTDKFRMSLCRTSVVCLARMPVRKVERLFVILSDVHRQCNHQMPKIRKPIPKKHNTTQSRNSTGRFQNMAGCVTIASVSMRSAAAAGAGAWLSMR